MGEIRKPIDYTVEAKPHTPVYRMHRYFARRPYSVFRELVNYYTKEGDIVLDPLCGGGVTIVEGLRLKRKVIGVDLNPMATFITKTECMSVNLARLKEEFNRISSVTKKDIEELYETKCPECKKNTPFQWMEWSHIYECPHCGNSALIFDCKKKGNGRYECNACKKVFVVTRSKRLGGRPTRIKFSCNHCPNKGIKIPDNNDIERVSLLKKDFSDIIKDKDLWYPTADMPMDYDLRRPYNHPMKKFIDFLTQRNLISIAMLFKEVNKIEDDELRYIMLNTFTSTLSWVTKLCVEPGHGWPISAYWVADVHYELNVWSQFNNRFKWYLRGKNYSNAEIGNYFKEAGKFEDIRKDSTAWILTKSSAKLPIPDNAVDAVITDPPYGWNVKYSELSNFSTIWLESLFKTSLVDNKDEAIISEYQNKNELAYEELLFRVFKECYRVLKPNGWMVMTFNNKESGVWMALLRAAQRANFYLPEDGIVYQDPIKHYTNTLYQRREGSVLGDFIYSFHKRENKKIQSRHLTNGEIKETVKKVASEIINKNGGATTSEIYQHAVPRLFNNFLMNDKKEMVPDVEKILQEEFEHKDFSDTRKWTVK